MRVELARPKALSLDTVLSVLAVSLAAAGGYLIFTRVGTPEGTLGWGLLAVGAALYVPRLFLTLELTEETIEVGVISGTRTFPFSELGRARKIDGLLVFRVFGVGAAGYHTGTFYLKGTGRVKAYASRWHGPLVLVERDDGLPIVLSPADPEGFLEAYREQRTGR